MHIFFDTKQALLFTRAILYKTQEFQVSHTHTHTHIYIYIHLYTPKHAYKYMHIQPNTTHSVTICEVEEVTYSIKNDDCRILIESCSLRDDRQYGVAGVGGYRVAINLFFT